MLKFKSMLRLLLLLLLIVSFSLSKELILASTYPIYYPLRYMADGRFDVDVLIKTKTDPHHYELKPEDARKLQKAKALFYLGVEAWEERLIRGPLKGKAIPLSVGMDLIKVNRYADPHVWMSPKSYISLVERVRDSLIKVDPSGSEHYRKKAEELINLLRNLDQEYKRVLDSCKSRTVVITHLSLLYLGRDYSLEVVGLRGLHAEEEPRPSEVRKMVEKARNAGVKAVFYEIGHDERLAKRLAKEIGAKTLPLNTSLFPENAQDDYISIMRKNLRSLSEGLSCQIR